jgi:hypothetical protein
VILSKIAPGWRSEVDLMVCIAHESIIRLTESRLFEPNRDSIRLILRRLGGLFTANYAVNKLALAAITI